MLNNKRKCVIHEISENTDPSDDSAKLWTSTSLEMAKGNTVC